MRITVQLDDKSLRDVQRVTGIRKKSPAVGKAVADYLREVQKRELIRRVMEGQVDYGATNAELEKSSRYDAY